MHTQKSKMKWAVLGIGMILVACQASPTQADHWWKFKRKSKTVDECPPDVVVVDECPKEKKCKRCGKCCGKCNCSCYLPVNPWYCDQRDLGIYSAQGYGVPVTVPSAPGAVSYNYGWGMPSTRLSQIGPYAAWNPDRPFSQAGGTLPGGVYPMVYHPTDTTQFGVYYNEVPTWRRVR